MVQDDLYVIAGYSNNKGYASSAWRLHLPSLLGEADGVCLIQQSLKTFTLHSPDVHCVNVYCPHHVGYALLVRPVPAAKLIQTHTEAWSCCCSPSGRRIRPRQR